MGDAFEIRVVQQLARMIEKVRCCHTFDQVADTVFEHARAFLPFDQLVIAFVHGDRQSLVVGPIRPKADSHMMGDRREAWKPARVKLERINNLQAERAMPFRSLFANAGMRSVFALPLTTRDEIFGAVWLGDHRTNAFKAEHVHVGKILSAVLSAALDGIRMSSHLATEKLVHERLQDAAQQLRELLARSPALTELIGESAIWRKMLQRIELVAATDSNVLILGETGTGKELVARAIHNLSSRKDRPFVAINCGALTPELIASELFGHERGAFTGALQRKIGRMEFAQNGTLFLDEIGELPPDMQVKLLRALQERTYERVGGSQTLKLNARIIAATNRNLEKARADGRFREDLYFRLNVFPISVPALRERKEDIKPLLTYFLNHYSQKAGKMFNGINPRILERCYLYHWPGNVRELENLVERSVILSPSKQFDLDPLTEHSSSDSQDCRLSEVIRSHLIKVLNSTRGKVYGPHGAAEILGLKPSTLQAKMSKYHISRADHTC